MIQLHCAAQGHDCQPHPVFISIADAWQVIAAGLVEVVELLWRLKLPPLPFSRAGTITQLHTSQTPLSLVYHLMNRLLTFASIAWLLITMPCCIALMLVMYADVTCMTLASAAALRKHIAVHASFGVNHACLVKDVVITLWVCELHNPRAL